MNYEGIGESLELVASCFKVVGYLEAKHFTLENPVGMLGRIFNQTRIEYKNEYFDKKATNFWSDMRGLKRALIPMDVRQRILDEVG